MPPIKRKLDKKPRKESDSGISSAEKSNGRSKADKSKQSSEVSNSWFGRCFTVFKFIVVIVVIPPFLNYTALIQESSQLLSDGLLYDIGFGQKLYLQCQGSGPPTVILDASTGMNSDLWVRVMKDLSSVTKVCRYDRAGIGLSDRPFRNYSAEEEPENKHKWNAFTVERMADDLHRLITYSSQQTKPVILVGSELGALVSLFYTQMYESDVADVVVINPLSEELFMQENNFWAVHWQQNVIPRFQALQMSAASGLSRFALMFGFMEHPMSHMDESAEIPAEVLQRQKHLMCNPRHLSSVVDEHYFINETLSQMRTILMMKSFPSNISLTILSSNSYDQSQPSAINKVVAPTWNRQKYINAKLYQKDLKKERDKKHCRDFPSSPQIFDYIRPADLTPHEAWSDSRRSLLAKLPPSTRFVDAGGDSDRYLPYKRPNDVINIVKNLVSDYRQRNSLS